MTAIYCVIINCSAPCDNRDIFMSQSGVVFPLCCYLLLFPHHVVVPMKEKSGPLMIQSSAWLMETVIPEARCKRIQVTRHCHLPLGHLQLAHNQNHQELGGRELCLRVLLPRLLPLQQARLVTFTQSSNFMIKVLNQNFFPQDFILRTKEQKTFYTAGRPPWYNFSGQHVEPFVIGNYCIQ